MLLTIKISVCMKRILLTLGVLISLHLHVFAQCDACDRTNPAAENYWIGFVPANGLDVDGETVCITSDVTYTTVYIHNGGVLNICDGATLTTTNGTMSFFTASTINIYGSSKFVSNGAFAEFNGGVNIDDCSNNNNYFTNGAIAAPPSCTPLPVEMTYFIGSVENDSVLLEWETLWEKDNSHFYIQRSEDLATWVNVDTIQGNGNTTEALVYNHSHPSPNERINYYRLIQVDYDGTMSQSKIIVLDLSIEENIERALISPNPASNELNLVYDKNSINEIKVITPSGEEILFLKEFDSNSIQVDISDIDKGLYFVQFNYPEEVIIERLIVE